MIRENDGDRTHDTQGHNLVLYQLSYILRGNLVYMTRAASATGTNACGGAHLAPTGHADAARVHRVRCWPAARP
jgi:hypothetical protein